MGTMWRPTIRCDSSYKDYIEELYMVTSLDKNQIIRLMMFVAANSDEFKQVISEYKKSDVTPLPSSDWRPWEDGYWLNQTYKRKGGSGVNVQEKTATQIQKTTSYGNVPGQNKEVPIPTIRPNGGPITFTYKTN